MDTEQPKECKICLTTSLEETRLKTEGLCSRCSVYKKPEVDYAKKREELEKVLARNKGGKIDVISALSGGKDSLYQLYLLSKELKLRTRAFTWDHYHAYPAAINSAKQAITDLGNVDWITTGFDFESSSKLLASYFMEVKRFCICPHFMMLRALPMAIDEEIPFIAIGYSKNQNERKGEYKFPDHDKRAENLKSWANSFRELTRYCLAKTFPKDEERITENLFGSINRSLEDIDRKEVVPGILQLSNFFPWERKDIENVVYERFGWKKSGRASLHSNCLFEPIRGYLEHTFGRPFLKDEANYLVRNEEMTKDEARRSLNMMGCSSKEPAVLDYFLKYANLSIHYPFQHFLEILKMLFTCLSFLCLHLFLILE